MCDAVRVSADRGTEERLVLEPFLRTIETDEDVFGFAIAIRDTEAA
jgi:hypothetical protein